MSSSMQSLQKKDDHTIIQRKKDAASPLRPSGSMMNSLSPFGNSAIQTASVFGNQFMLQRQASQEEEIQTKSDDEEIQTKEESAFGGTEEEVQKKSDDEEIQAKEEEEIQTKEESAFGGTEEEEIQTKADEEEIQTKSNSFGALSSDEEVQTQSEEEEIQAEEEEGVQTKEGISARNNEEIAGRIRNSRGGGDPLPEKTRSEMEGAFSGQDFSGVRIHTDSRAADLNKDLKSKAFTNREDIHFNTGQYSLESQSGKHLLAHELTHVVQQKTVPDLQTKLNDPEQRSQYEVEADRAADTVVGGGTVQTNASISQVNSPAVGGVQLEGKEEDTSTTSREIFSLKEDEDFRVLDDGRILIRAEDYKGTKEEVQTYLDALWNEGFLLRKVSVDLLIENFNLVILPPDKVETLPAKGVHPLNLFRYAFLLPENNDIHIESDNSRLLIYITKLKELSDDDIFAIILEKTLMFPLNNANNHKKVFEFEHVGIYEISDPVKVYGVEQWADYIIRQKNAKIEFGGGSKEGESKYKPSDPYPISLSGPQIGSSKGSSLYEVTVKYPSENIQGEVAHAINPILFYWDVVPLNKSDNESSETAYQRLHKELQTTELTNVINAADNLKHKLSILNDGYKLDKSQANNAMGSNNGTVSDFLVDYTANQINKAVLPGLHKVRYALTGVKGLGEFLGDNHSHSRTIPFKQLPGPGKYVIRVISSPTPLGEYLPKPSYQTKLVNVVDPENHAKNAFDDEQKDLSDEQVKALTLLEAGKIKDVSELKEIQERINSKDLQIHGSPMQILLASRKKIEDAITTAKLNNQTDKLKFKQEDLKKIDERIQKLKNSQERKLGVLGRSCRLHAYFTSKESAQRVPLVLNLDLGQVYLDFRISSRITDLTPKGVIAPGSSGIEKENKVEAAIHNAMKEFSQKNGYGDGYITYKLPKEVSDSEEVFKKINNTSGLSEARTNLQELISYVGIVLLFVPGGQAAGITIGIASGILAAERMLARYYNGNLKADNDTLLDLIDIISALLTAGQLKAKQLANVTDDVLRTSTQSSSSYSRIMAPLKKVPWNSIAQWLDKGDTAFDWVSHFLEQKINYEAIQEIEKKIQAKVISRSTGEEQKKQLILAMIQSSSIFAAGKIKSKIMSELDGGGTNKTIRNLELHNHLHFRIKSIESDLFASKNFSASEMKTFEMRLKLIKSAFESGPQHKKFELIGDVTRLQNDILGIPTKNKIKEDIKNKTLKPISQENLTTIFQDALGKKNSDIKMYRDDNISGNGVRVHYDVDWATGAIKDIHIRFGKNASHTNISEHKATVDALKKYKGTIGKLRILTNRLGVVLGLSDKVDFRDPTTEIKFEIIKLTKIMQNRVQWLNSKELSVEDAHKIQKEIQSLHKQISAQGNRLDYIFNQKGGSYTDRLDYIAMEDTNIDNAISLTRIDELTNNQFSKSSFRNSLARQQISEYREHNPNASEATISFLLKAISRGKVYNSDTKRFVSIVYGKGIEIELKHYERLQDRSDITPYIDALRDYANAHRKNGGDPLALVLKRLQSGNYKINENGRVVSIRSKETARFDKQTDPEQAYEYLINNSGSYQAWDDMLKGQGVEFDAKKFLLDRFKTKNLQDISIDKIRHELKSHSKELLLKKLVTSEIDFNDPAQRAKAHKDFLEMTKHLNSSDKGNLAETWYARVYLEEIKGMVKGKDYDDHTVIDREMLENAGIRDLPDKFFRTLPDLTYAGVLHDIKSHSGVFGAHDKLQFEIFLKIVTNGTVKVSENGVPFTELRYTLTSPEGAKANVDFIMGTMLKSEKIQIEIFDSTGNKLILTGGSRPRINGKKVSMAQIEQTINNL